MPKAHLGSGLFAEALESGCGCTLLSRIWKGDKGAFFDSCIEQQFIEYLLRAKHW